MTAQESLAWLASTLELPITAVGRAETRWLVTLEDGEQLDFGSSHDVLSTEALTRAIELAGGVLPARVTPRHVLASLWTLAKAG